VEFDGDVCRRTYIAQHFLLCFGQESHNADHMRCQFYSSSYRRTKKRNYVVTDPAPRHVAWGEYCTTFVHREYLNSYINFIAIYVGAKLVLLTNDGVTISHNQILIVKLIVALLAKKYRKLSEVLTAHLPIIPRVRTYTLQLRFVGMQFSHLRLGFPFDVFLS
jgi:hypothetical protein